MNTELGTALERVARRFRRLRVWIALTVCWLLWALAGGLLAAWLAHTGQRPVGAAGLLASFGALVALSGATCWWLARRSVRGARWVASRIEARHPELATGLLAAVEEDAAPPRGFLQRAVVARALEHDHAHDWRETVPTRALDASRLSHLTAACMLVVAFTALAAAVRPSAARHRTGGADAAGVGLRVEPGDAEIERGYPLLVVARFAGTVPPAVRLVVEPAGAPAVGQSMTRSLDDPTYAGRVASVDADLAYRVEYGGQSSPTYHVRVFDYPSLRRADATLAFPTYTALGTKTVEDVRHVTAVEGTNLSLRFLLNKDVARARLVDEAGQALDLEPIVDHSHAYGTSMKLADSKRYELQLVDADGRANKDPAGMLVNVTRDRPPTVIVTRPARDVRVSAVEELSLLAKVDDDYGVVRHGLTYSVGGQAPTDLVLAPPAGAGKSAQATHLLDFESLRVAPDQLVTYFFWAEDVGPNEQPRRTSGDLFFAEVRPFEEVFRQGEQPPSGSAEDERERNGEGNGQESEELAELQKQIVNGTWTLLRRETGARPSPKFAEDLKVLSDSQHDAIEQAGRLGGRLRDATSKQGLEQAVDAMKEAETKLGQAAGAGGLKALTPALAAEKAAYQALLKLRAREYEVARGNSRSRGRGRSAGGPSQRQLDQLELSNEQDRYEDERTARSQEAPLSQRDREQAEDRQVASRLRELARRQADLNDRLKELQAALEAAQDEKAREEVARQLERLREQQRQVLRDADELRERMEREENRERMADARQQVEQGRDHLRRASQALEEGRLSQALTEGTRAGRQMDDLRDRLRQDSAGRFREDLTEMRDQSRQLDEDQKAVSERLEAQDQQPRGARSLRDPDGRAPVARDLARQRERLERMLDRMRKTVRDAEEAEPLLAKELFDTVRKTADQKTDEALDEAGKLSEAGIPREAAKASRRAGEGLTQLREGIERAARNVLGDEAEALRRARAELDDLAEQVNREIAQATDQPDAKGQVEPAGEPAARKDQQPRPQGQQGRQGQDGQQAQQDQRQERQPGQRGQRRQGQQGQQGGEGPRTGARRVGSLRQDEGGPEPGERRQRGGGIDRLLEGTARGPGGPGGPITGEGFREWSDRMRDVEELLDDPKLRSEAAQVRDRARGARDEMKRHAKVPDWGQLKTMVADPLLELRNRVAEEVRRRESPDALVPIDRDPVPPRYAEGVRRYLERLGSGR